LFSITRVAGADRIIAGPPSRNASTSGFDHDECALRALTEFADKGHHRLTEAAPRVIWKADQEYPGGILTPGVRKQLEILVFREENPRLRAGQRENVGIFRARADLCYGGHIVTRRAESSDHRKVAALIGEETHWLLVVAATALTDENHFLVSERVSRVTHRGVNVVSSAT
jgi:hypothetical protein